MLIRNNSLLPHQLDTSWNSCFSLCPLNTGKLGFNSKVHFLHFAGKKNVFLSWAVKAMHRKWISQWIEGNTFNSSHQTISARAVKVRKKKRTAGEMCHWSSLIPQDTMAIKKRSSRTRRIRPVSTRLSEWTWIGLNIFLKETPEALYWLQWRNKLFDSRSLKFSRISSCDHLFSALPLIHTYFSNIFLGADVAVFPHQWLH